MTSPLPRSTVIPMRSFAPAAVLIVLLPAALTTAVYANDSDRRIRNVTPDNIPVIILPPGVTAKKSNNVRDEKADALGSTLTVAVSGDTITKPSGEPLLLAGVRILAQDTLCVTNYGGRWACGLRAHIAIRNFIHGKPVSCEVTTAGERCTRERVDISSWMLSEGWALYSPSANDDALSQMSDDARKNGRGIWAGGSHPAEQ